MFNVIVQMWFEAENMDDAEKMAYNAMSLIPKGEEPIGYEIVEVLENRS